MIDASTMTSFDNISDRQLFPQNMQISRLHISTVAKIFPLFTAHLKTVNCFL